MLYCFIDQDLEAADGGAPLMVEYRYATAIRAALVYSQRDAAIKPFDLFQKALDGERVLVRASYQMAPWAIEALSDMGVSLIEGIDEFRRTERWPCTHIARRRVDCVNLNDLQDHVRQTYSEDVELFVKSMHKGYTARLSSRRILNPDSEVDSYFNLLKHRCGDMAIVSRYHELKRDSLGSLEARIICIDGLPTSISRPLFGIRHAVSARLRREGQTILDTILDCSSFPRSFALDVGLFREEDQSWVDVVEINPLSAATCYVNNTVFTERLPEIDAAVRRLRMGIEYCYDYVSHPKRYAIHRHASKRYSNEPKERFIIS